MPIILTLDCPLKKECKFGKGCLALKPFDKGGTYGPVLKQGVVDLKMQVRCFSFQPIGEDYDRKKF